MISFPGTSACANQKFYCKNDYSSPKQVFSSRVHVPPLPPPLPFFFTLILLILRPFRLRFPPPPLSLPPLLFSQDGYCDCCDGSDEFDVLRGKYIKQCPNTCAEEGKAYAQCTLSSSSSFQLTFNSSFSFSFSSSFSVSSIIISWSVFLSFTS